MPDSPDFDQIARRLIDRTFRPDPVGGLVRNGMWEASFARAVAEQLRQVWIVRGAVDADLLRRALVVVEAHAEEYPTERLLAAEIADALLDR